MANILPTTIVVLLMASSAMGNSALLSFPEFVSGSHCGLRILDASESLYKLAHEKYFGLDSTSGWILMNFAGPSTISLKDANSGGPDQVVKLLLDDQVQYGVIRVKGIPPGGTKSITRDIFFVWIGPNVSAADKKLKATKCTGGDVS